MTSGYRDPPCCANHPERVARSKCPGCLASFCDGSLPFLVNDAPWCEVCGNRVAASSAPKWGRAAVAFVVTWGPLTLLFMLAGRLYPIAMVVFYGLATLFVINVAVPLRGTERPRITRR